MNVLVTGATDGIGRQTALELARLGHHVIVHGRNNAKVEAARQSILKAVPGASLDLVAFDLSSLAAIRAGAADLMKKHQQLDVLINNAGVLLQDRTVTADGFETTFAVNHLAPFLLTNILLPILKGDPARIVNVSSQVHLRARLDFNDLQLERGYSGYEAYARSKLANVLFTHSLARRLDATRITANSLHPGVIATKLLRQGFGMAGGGDLAEGARTSVFVATAPELKGVTDQYFSNARRAQASAEGQSDANAARLWEISARLTGLSGS